MNLHFHRDPNWHMRGANAYYECRCGARRVRHLNLRIASPVKPGWPCLISPHGVRILDTGWVKR